MRNLKILGLAVVAMLAMSVVASAAQAASFTASGGAGKTLTGTQVTKHVFSTVAGVVKCSVASFTGTTTGTAATTQTITPTYSGCTLAGTLVADISFATNGCDYLFAASGGVTVSCSGATKSIIVTVTSETGSSRCTISVPAQALTGNVYDSNGAGLLVTTSVSGIQYSINNSACAEGTAGTHSDGTYSGSSSLSVSSGSVSWDA